MDKKRAEGKPYLVYMTAGANKFLRIYYGRVKEYLASLEEKIKEVSFLVADHIAHTLKASYDRKESD